jgi:ribokinase
MAARATIHVVGSMMIDRVVHVRTIPRPGETIAALSAQTFAGGKGANQAAAAAKCGARVRMLGRTGEDGAFIRDALEVAGVRVRDVAINDKVSGSATVMVAADGENAIVIAPESNLRLTKEAIERFLERAKQTEIVLFQNECALLHEGIALAAKRALRVWLNAAPADERLRSLRLEKLAGLIVNETEAEAITGERDPRRALEALAKRMPGGTAIITLGAQGAIAALGSARYAHSGYVVDAVDTVGCGDAFVGAYLAAIIDGRDIAQALARGNAAGALAAMRAGAMRSLPAKAEIDVASAFPEGTRLKPRPPAEDEGMLPPRCTRCDYDLHGKGEGEACPECGHIVRRFLFPGAWADARVRRRLASGARWVTAAWACALLAALLYATFAVLSELSIRPGAVFRSLFSFAFLALIVLHALAGAWAETLVARGLPDPKLGRIGRWLAASRALVPLAVLALSLLGRWRGVPALPDLPLQHVVSWAVLVDLLFLGVLARAWRKADFTALPIRPLVIAVVGALAAWSALALYDDRTQSYVIRCVFAACIGVVLLWTGLMIFVRRMQQEIRARE